MQHFSSIVSRLLYKHIHTSSWALSAIFTICYISQTEYQVVGKGASPSLHSREVTQTCLITGDQSTKFMQQLWPEGWLHGLSKNEPHPHKPSLPLPPNSYRVCYSKPHLTEIRNNSAVSHPQSNPNPQPKNPHTTRSPPRSEPSASEKPKNMRDCFMADIAPLCNRSLSETEWADFEDILAKWTTKLAEDEMA